ncbi:hypothetical protein DSCO28_37480 [Desulfosarcina ovata subsp. sediminis]|uniref:Uncharacterized protein n=1 Tax=Desulfosarcina ovata subsp. sediminis TaxID=885957 RepID=A0A5K7ZSK0_9BACT|nr:hypothetical protein [Desulfosarcina ovata]BBO83182.1 hypothetical protein DSCO28_37480 [Desulfosarcina ovata subsp. sediminis]
MILPDRLAAIMGDSKQQETAAVTESIENADGFAQVFYVNDRLKLLAYWIFDPVKPNLNLR